MGLKQFRSRFLKVVAAGYIAFPPIYLGATAVFFDIPFDGVKVLLFSPFFWFVCAWAMATGYGLWEMRRWSWYLFLFTNTLVVYQSVLACVTLGETHHKALSLLFFTLLIVLLTHRVGKEIRVPYFLPKIKWWESNTRYQLSVPATLRLQADAASLAVGQILDLSIGGCYLKTKAAFLEGQKVEVEFRVFGHKIHLLGLVVWKSGGSVTRPEGVGVKFMEISTDQRRMLRVALKRIQRITAFYKRMPEEAEESIARAFEDEPLEELSDEFHK